MINLFRKLNPLILLLLVFIAIVLRIGVLVQLPETIEFNFLESYAASLVDLPSDSLFNSASNVFFAAVITLIQAVIFNRIINNYNLLGRPSFLPALMYITASGLLAPFLVLSPALICNFLMLWIIDKFLKIYRKAEVRSTMFDLGMIIAAGTLIYFPFVAIFPLLWISLIMFRPFDWREWISGIIGFVTIYFFIAVFYYLSDSYNEINSLKVPLAKDFPALLHINLYDYIVLVPLLLILILAIISLQQKLYRSSVHIRKSYLLLFYIMIFSLLAFFLKPEYHVYHFLLAVPSTAVFMAHYFMNATKRWFYESLYILLLAFMIYFQFV